MKLYRVIYPGGGSLWVGTQADAKRTAKEQFAATSWEQVEVPTDKEGLLAFLNAAVPACEAPRSPAVTPPPSPGAGRDADSGRCPKCNLTRRGAELHAKGMKADAIAEEIMKADGFVLGNLAGAVAGRFAQLKQTGA